MRIGNVVLFAWMSLLLTSCAEREEKAQPPNFVIIFTDDQGYQDLGAYGSPNIKTPNLDRMASEGMILTDFYVSMSVCSATRASLLTGQYSFNNGVAGVFFPDHQGMDSANVILPELLKTRGYKTTCIGKWHLGDLEGHMPMDQGFDAYYGIPYSNDMYIGFNQRFSEKVTWNNGYNLQKAMADQDSVKVHSKNRKRLAELGLRNLVPLMEGNEIIAYPADQSTLTQRYFERAIQFMDETGDEPFLIYLTPAMPHVPLFASDQFTGKSKRGRYGDVIEEIDHYTGKLLEYLRSNELAENTLVIYTSDNGPWLGKGKAAGSAAPLRDGKFSRYEGGLRVPSIMWWPGTIPAGITSDQVVSTLDLVPTLTSLAGINREKLHVDGYDLSSFLSNPMSNLKDHPILFLDRKEIAGIRMGDFKYLRYSGKRNASKKSAPELYHLPEDISEINNVAEKHPEIIAQLEYEISKFEMTQHPN